MKKIIKYFSVFLNIVNFILLTIVIFIDSFQKFIPNLDYLKLFSFSACFTALFYIIRLASLRELEKTYIFLGAIAFWGILGLVLNNLTNI